MRAFAIAATLVIAAACRSGSPTLPVACPDSTWRTTHTPNGRVALCLPPRFRTVDSTRRWARSEPVDSDFVSFSFAVLDSTEAVDEWGSPPRSRKLGDAVDTTKLHAVVADSVMITRTMVDGRGIDVETALASGGIGMHRQPLLLAVWPLSRGRRALAQGFATNARNLDLARQMLATVRLSAEHY